MKTIFLKAALVFLMIMFGIQLAFILSYAFYPKGTETLTNLITKAYNQIG